MRIKIHGLETWALLDSGSQMTCVSEEFYKRLILIREVSEQIYIATVIGKKATKISKQIFVEFEVNKDTFS